MNKVKYLFLVFVILFSINIASATNYYVDVDGVHGSSCSDSNPGTSWSSPFCSIQAAIDVIPYFETFTQTINIIVANGTYYDSNVDGIVIRIQYKDPTQAFPLIVTSEYKYGAKIDGQNIAGDGFFLYGSPHISIGKFDIFNVIDEGINVGDGSDHIIIQENKIHDVCRMQLLCSDDRSNYGHDAIFTDTTVNDVIINRNIFYDIGRTAGGCPDPEGTGRDYNSDQLLYIESSNNIITNNLFYNVNKTGYNGWPISLANGNDNSVVIGNTIYGLHGDNPARYGHILIKFDIYNITILNNIFDTPGPYAIYDYPSDLNNYYMENAIIKNNLANNVTGSLYGGLIDYDNGGGSYTILGNLINQFPSFINLNSRNFHLNSDSPAINNGTSSGAPLYDFDGNLRGSPHDIGAYEYVSGGVLPPTIPSPITIPPSITTSQILSSIWSWLISIFGT